MNERAERSRWLAWIALAACVIVACVTVAWLLWLWPRDGRAGDARATLLNDRRVEEGAGIELDATREATRDATGAIDDDAAKLRASEKAVSLDGSLLREQLEAVARAEQDAAKELNAGAVTAEAQSALERALEPLLYAPDNLYRALDMLSSGELAIEIEAAGASGREGNLVGSDPDQAELSMAEYGAVRAIYWALLAYTAPESELVRAGVAISPADLLLNVVTALPNLRGRVQRFLLVQLTEARLEGAVVLGKALLGPILYLRDQFPEHKELFSALLKNIGESMSAEERNAVFAGLLDERADATLVGITLGSLLRDDEGAAALGVARALYDSKAGGAAESARRKQAIVNAVAEHATDPFDAARFLAERSVDTRNMIEAYWKLGEREGGLQALEAQYHELSASNDNARGRLALVLGMNQAPPERLLDIAANDTDAEVRGQAVLTLTSSDGYVASRAHVEFLQGGLSSAAPLPLQSLAGAAANLANTARRGGEPQLAKDAVELLKSVGGDARASARVRASVATTLRSHLSSAEFETWVGDLRARGIEVTEQR